MMLAMLISVVLQQGAPVAEPGWVELGRIEGETIFIQTANVPRRGSVVRAWSWSRLDSPWADGSTSLFFQNDYDCTARTYTLVAFRSVGAGGAVIREETVADEDRQTSEIRPGTSAEREMQAVCR